ncbi:MAG: hypothetical protein WA952_08705 [Lewinella sp.]
MKKFYPLLICASFLANQLSLPAQTLVANISQGNAGSNPTALQSDGQHTIFMADDGTGFQLYYLGPQDSSAVSLRDRSPDLMLDFSSNPKLIEEYLYFQSFTSDHTVYQRIRLSTGEITTLATLSSDDYTNRGTWFTAINGLIVFVHTDENYQSQLYRYDPADESVIQLQQLPDDFISRVIPIGNRLFFEYSYSPEEFVPFVVTDGTIEGSRVVYPPEGFQFVSPTAAVDSMLIAQVVAPGVAETYVYDENFFSPAPLREVFTSIAEGYTQFFAHRQDGLYFVLQDDQYRQTIYRIDTATSVAEPVIELNPNRDTIGLRTAQFFDDIIFYTVSDPASRSVSLYRTDGSAEGTYLLRDSISGRSSNGFSLGQVVASGDQYYFLADTPETGTELWRTDGTVEGTQLVDDLYPGPDSPDISQPIRRNNGVIFVADHPDYGQEVFIVRDDSSTIELLVDGNTTETGSYPNPLAVVNDRLLLAASTPCTGFELFATQGSGVTTSLVADLNAGRQSSDPYVTTFVGDTAYLNINGFRENFLYGTDGTSAGTFVLDPDSPVGANSLISGATRLGDRLLLRTYVNGVGQALYSIDPPTGNYELITILESAFGGNSRGEGFVPLNDSILLFVEATRDYGPELWRTNGTEAGTYVVKDIRQIEENSLYYHISDITILDGLAYFTADPGMGRRIYRSDGTESGTYALSGDSDLSNPSAAFLYDGTVHFAAGEFGRKRLFTTSGTPNDVNPSPITASSQFTFLSDFRVLGERLVFSGDTDATGTEPWAAAGPEAPATILRDLFIGPDPSYPRDLYVVNDSTLLFSAEVPEIGRELWSTDGTAIGTFLVADIQPGTASSDPTNFFAYGAFTYFSADDGVVGAELWKYAAADLDNDGYVGAEDADEGDPLVNAGTNGDPNDVNLACGVATDPPTSATELSAIEVRVFPNPATDVLRIRVEDQLPVRAYLYTADGRLAFASAGPANQFDISVQGWGSGRYTLILQETSGRVVSRRNVTVIR